MSTRWMLLSVLAALLLIASGGAGPPLFSAPVPGMGVQMHFSDGANSASVTFTVASIGPPGPAGPMGPAGPPGAPGRETFTPDANGDGAINIYDLVLMGNLYGKPIPSGELRIALSYSGMEALDPSLNLASGKHFLTLLFDYLVGHTPEGQLSTETGLAYMWEMAPDARKWTFHLRQGVKFHNGDEVTAEDVKFSLEYFMRSTSVSTYAGTLRAVIDRIEVPEPYTVVVYTKNPYIFLAHDLSALMGVEGMVLPRKYILEKGEANFNLKPVGSGPYKFAEQVVGSYISYEALDQHWRVGVPRYKRVTLFLVPDEATRIALLRTGQADVIDLSRDRIREVTAAGFSTFRKKESDIVGLMMTQQWEATSVFRDKRVREALSLAINRQAILDNIFAGQGQVSGNFFGGSWGLGYQPLAPYPYDPARAKGLLAEAGYPNGFSLDLYSYPRPGLPEGPQMMEAIAGYWSAIGVQARIVVTDYVTFRTKWNGKTAANSMGWLGTSNRPFWHSLYRAVYHSTGSLTLLQDPQVDGMVERMEGAADLATYALEQATLDRYIYDNYLTIPILETGQVYATSPKITAWDLGKAMYDMNLEDLVRRK